MSFVGEDLEDDQEQQPPRPNQGDRERRHAGGARHWDKTDVAFALNAYDRKAASITALILLVASAGFMLFIERFLKADVLAKVGS